MTRIGFAYNQKPELPVGLVSATPTESRPDEEPPSKSDVYAEWDSVETIDAVATALSAYGELACDTIARAPYTGIDVGFSSLCIDKEITYEFVSDVLGELAEMTPGPYIHIGGDEVLKDMWKDLPAVKELMARENLKDLNEVQSYFVRRIEKFINVFAWKVID